MLIIMLINHDLYYRTAIKAKNYILIYFLVFSAWPQLGLESSTVTQNSVSSVGTVVEKCLNILQLIHQTLLTQLVQFRRHPGTMYPGSKAFKRCLKTHHSNWHVSGDVISDSTCYICYIFKVRYFLSIWFYPSLITLIFLMMGSL